MNLVLLKTNLVRKPLPFVSAVIYFLLMIHVGIYGIDCVCLLLNL